MSTESLSEKTLTATVAIFSEDMRRVVMHVHRKFDRVMPPGGKFDPIRDRDILDTALRETGEEIGLALFPGTGVFLDIKGRPVSYAEYVETSSYVFPGKNELAIDHLFYFRLHGNSVQFAFKNESKGFFLDKKTIQMERVEIERGMYGLPFPNIKDAILDVMRE